MLAPIERLKGPLLLLVLFAVAACKPNPTPQQACTLGANGGNPVIIVAGTFSPAIANEIALGTSLYAAGHTHCVLELKGEEAWGELPGTINIDISAAALKVFVDDVLDWAGESKVDLVGHSQGALAARSYIKKFGGALNVDTMVSLSGPNRGTNFAALLSYADPLLAPFGITCESVEPCTQMILDSDWVTDLNAGDMTPGDVDYYAFYTNNDQLVWYWGTGLFGFPVIKYDNAELGPGATNMELGEQCPLRVVGHLGMIFDPVPIHMTLDALAGRPISVPLPTCFLPPVVI
ncbi:MAG: lipase family alpha/beta hydrolase [Halioglobus sp.]